MSNFFFLKKYWPELEEYGSQAEYYVYSDANASLIKQRILGEKIIEMLFVDCYGEGKRVGKTFKEMIEQLSLDNEIPEQIADIIHQVRKCGNTAAHTGKGTVKVALSNLKNMFHFCEWFMQESGDYWYESKPFVNPQEQMTNSNFLNTDMDYSNNRLVDDLVKETKKISDVLHNAKIIKEKGRSVPGKHSVAGKSTITGFQNDQDQKNEGRTEYNGTDYGQKLYRMLCMKCGRKYYVNGSTIYNSKCPQCMGGKEITINQIDVNICSLNNIGDKREKAKSVSGKSTIIGFINNKNQKNIGKTEYEGTDHGQKLYQMECQKCKMTYYVNGSTIYNAKCPSCMAGKDIKL